MGIAALLGARSLYSGYRDLADARAEPFSADRKDYLGERQADGISLKIGEDRSVEYKHDATSRSVTGRLRRFKGNDLVIKGPSGNDTLTVQKPPLNKDGMWTMTVEGDAVARKDEWVERRERMENSMLKQLPKQQSPSVGNPRSGSLCTMNREPPRGFPSSELA